MPTIFKAVFTFFDKLEDKIRIRLSHYPLIYALVGAIGIILVWKGVWETASFFPWLTGPMSVVLGVTMLLSTGLLVSFFIGDSIIISGLKREKKIVEKTEEDLGHEEDTLQLLVAKIDSLQKEVSKLKKTKK